jgi:VIT1/CCC1 family predicted Fe2+/Mn2+ transporter
MKESFRVGVSFGLTSGIITTLGLMVGLESGTHSQLAVVSGILTIAIADALGIHISEESENRHTVKEIWQSTLFTFLSKLVFASSFIIPLFLFSLPTAVVVAVFWGFFLLGGFSFLIARAEKAKPLPVIAEHLVIAGAVILITDALGRLIQRLQ